MSFANTSCCGFDTHTMQKRKVVGGHSNCVVGVYWNKVLINSVYDHSNFFAFHINMAE